VLAGGAALDMGPGWHAGDPSRGDLGVGVAGTWELASNVCSTYDRRVAAARREVANREAPAQIPVRPQGDFPVIVRVVWDDGTEEWRPARAVRWTAEHVMVAWRDVQQDPRSERYEWLRAGDVARSVSWFVGPPPRTVPAVSARS